MHCFNFVNTKHSVQNLYNFVFTSNCLCVNSFHPVQPLFTEHVISKVLYKPVGWCTCNVTLRHIHATTAAMKKQYVLHILSVYLSSMQSTCIIIRLSSVTCLAVPHFTILSHKGYNFQKKGTEHQLCVLIFYTTFAQKHFSF